MISFRSRYILSLVLIFISFIDVKSQEKKKISFNVMTGTVFFPKSEKIPSYGMLPANIFGGYSISGMGGLGFNYRLSQKLAIFENVTFLKTSKKNNSLSASTFKTGLKYNFLDKKISPYVFGSIDFLLMFLNRKENSTAYYLDSTTNTIGAGYGGTKIIYNEERLNLSFVPVAGASVGAGMNFKVSKKLDLFLAYSYNTALASRSHIIKKNFFNNKSDFSYSMVNAGLTIHLFKKTKQLLANLGKEEWEGDNTISVRGTIVYQKVKKSNNKIIAVELTNVKDSTLKVLSSDKDGSFYMKDLTLNDYKFMLDKKNRKIKNAELEIIHDHRKVKVAEEFQAIDMFDDVESENLISREGNFSVVLREGFQHEINLTVTGKSINGNLNNVNPDTSCHDIEVLLYDKQDSLIKGVSVHDNCTFNIPDVEPGKYKMVFRNGNEKAKMSFNYNFTEAVPTITRQVNDVAPKIIYYITGKVDVEDTLNSGNIELHLVDLKGKVLQKKSIILPGEFGFENLPSGNYQINYELSNKRAKGKIEYFVKADNSAFNKSFVYYFGNILEDTTSELSVEGQVINSAKSMEGVDVYLIDSTHQVIGKTKTDMNGNFHFPKLPPKGYKISYALDDSTLKTDLKYKVFDKNKIVVDDNTQINEMTFSASAVKKVSIESKSVFRKNVKTEEFAKNNDKTLEKKSPLKNNLDYNNFQTHQTYSANGEPLQLSGFGVQIGSFKMVSNLKKSITLLKEKGFSDIYIQVINLSLNGKDEKLYRVLLGVYDDLNDLREREQILKEAGFRTIYRKHLN